MNQPCTRSPKTLKTCSKTRGYNKFMVRKNGHENAPLQVDGANHKAFPKQAWSAFPYLKIGSAARRRHSCADAAFLHNSSMASCKSYVKVKEGKSLFLFASSIVTCYELIFDLNEANLSVYHFVLCFFITCIIIMYTSGHHVIYHSA